MRNFCAALILVFWLSCCVGTLVLGYLEYTRESANNRMLPRAEDIAP